MIYPPYCICIRIVYRKSREEYSSATGFVEIILPEGAKSRVEAVEKFIKR
jgi:hypothetical protein